MLLARRKEPERRLRHQCGPFGDSGAGTIGDRDQPFPPAFSAQDEEGLVGRDGIARERYELGRAKTRSVEQLDEGRHAQGGCVSLLVLAPLALPEQGVDRGVIEDFGQRSLAPGSWQRGGRIVGAQALVVDEGEEATKRGGLPRHRRALERKPGLAEAL